jgi:hypothetical protein
MDAASPFATEKQEQVLRRMEQLHELRRASRLPWYQYLRIAVMILGGLWFIFEGSDGGGLRTSHGLRSPNMIEVVMGIFLIGNAVFAGVIVPMRRRVDALEQLLEAEIKRSGVK